MPHFVHATPQIISAKRIGNYAVFVGRLDLEKGINTLLEAWRHLEFPLKIRGSGRLEEKARDFVKQHDMKNVEFVGRMEENELSNLIGNARFLVMPSEGYYETFGMVIIEFFSREVPW